MTLTRGAQTTQTTHQERVRLERLRAIDQCVEHLVVTSGRHVEAIADRCLFRSGKLPPLALEREDLTITIAELDSGRGGHRGSHRKNMLHTDTLGDELHRCNPARRRSGKVETDVVTDVTDVSKTSTDSVAPIRWGILGLGRIAHTFANDLALVPDAELVAVGSRRQATADAFAAEHGGTPYASYEALLADPSVDVVYIASPHSEHLAYARLAFEAGKHVLSEKPLTVTLADAEEMVRLAAQHDRFLMEGMWTACHPAIIDLRRRLASGEFGTPSHVHAELGFVVTDPPTSRMFDPRLGAGALLDMGIYPLTFAHLLFGEALELAAEADVRTTEHGSFDMSIAIAGRYPGDVLATMNASMNSWSSRAGAIATDRGRLDIVDFHHPTAITFTPFGVGSTNDETVRSGVVSIPIEGVIGRGYGNEIVEVQRCLRVGLRESALVPHGQTLTIMRQMQELLTKVGVGYR